MNDSVYIRQGKTRTLNITEAKVVAVVPADFAAAHCRIVRVQVLVAGSAPGAVYDAETTGGNSVANQVGAVPSAIGSYLIDMPCQFGILVVPGVGQTLAVSYD
jgi:hypothetical protein